MQALTVVLAAALLVAATAGDATARSDRERKSCARSGTTVAVTKEARIFRRGPASIPTWYGCSFRRDRIHRLGSIAPGSSPQGIAKLRLTGHYAAFEHYWCDRDAACAAGVDVRNLRTGRSYGAEATAGRVRALAVNRHGVAAWIQGDDGDDLEVRSLSRDRVVVLATGRDIEIASLAMNGDWVYWRQAGEPRAAAAD